MQLEKIADIIGAKIKNSDAVLHIENVTIQPSEAEPGTLCFCNTEMDAYEAIQNGASAIVCQENIMLPESAKTVLLRITDVGESALRLAGHVQGELHVSIELIDPKVMTFLQMIVTHHRIFMKLPVRWQQTFETVMEVKKPLLLTTDTTLFHILRPAKKPFTQKVPGYVVSVDSLFCTTFKIEKYIYQYKKLSHLHLEALRCAIALCEAYELPYSLEKLRYTRHLYPIYLEGECTIGKKMWNRRMVILSDNLEDILQAREYTASAGHWLPKTLVTVPSNTKVEGLKHPLYYGSYDEVVEIIGSRVFDYLFVYTQDLVLEDKIRRVFL